MPCAVENIKNAIREHVPNDVIAEHLVVEFFRGKDKVPVTADTSALQLEEDLLCDDGFVQMYFEAR